MPAFNLYNLSVELLLFTVILFSPVIHGGVTILPLTLLEGGILVLFLACFINAIRKNRILIDKESFIFLFVFLIIITLQLIRLPFGILSFISPKTFFLYDNFRLNPPGDLTLSVYPDITVHYLLQILSYAMLFFAVINYVDSKEKGRRLVLVIIISGIIYSLFGIIKKSFNPGPGFATFTNRNHFAAYIQLIIPVTLAYAFTLSSFIKRVLVVFISSLMSIDLFYSWSRAGRICFVMGIVIFSVLFFVKKPSRLVKPFNIIIFLIFFLFFLWLIGPSPLFNRLETLASPLNAYGNRLNYFFDTLNIIRDFPVFGTGLGTYAEIIQKYKTIPDYISYGFSHNEPIQLLSEVGVTGFLIIFFFLASVFLKAFFAWLKRKNRYSVFITIGCLAGLLSVLFHSLFDFVFHTPANAILFFIILGLALKTANISSLSNQEIAPFIGIKLSLIKRFFFSVLIFLFAASFSTVILKRLKAELIFEGVKKGKIYGLGTDLFLSYNKSIRTIDKAIVLNPLNSGYFCKKADLLVDLAGRRELEGDLAVYEGFGGRDKILVLARSFYEKAISLNPSKADYHLRLGWLYTVLGEPLPAQKEFQRAALLDPQNKEIKAYISKYLAD